MVIYSPMVSTCNFLTIYEMETNQDQSFLLYLLFPVVILDFIFSCPILSHPNKSIDLMIMANYDNWNNVLSNLRSRKLRWPDLGVSFFTLAIISNILSLIFNIVSLVAHKMYIVIIG